MLRTSKLRHLNSPDFLETFMRIMGDRPSPASRSRTFNTQWVPERALAHGANLCVEAYELLACLVSCFPSSHAFEAGLREFAVGTAALFDVDAKHDAIPVVALPPPPPLPEIKLMIDPPFSPSRLGHPAFEYPRALVFLCQAALELGGVAVLRVPGDADAVTELRLHIDHNRCDATGIADPSVPTGLLKSWLCELADPLVPMGAYYACLEIGKVGEVVGAVAILDTLPDADRRVARYLLSEEADGIDVCEVLWS
ncbi:hypothetical protein H9P43_007062 [Blastocladiella emersonii ATCC 22665]|nr:hypothetical protein H9P43_007062 [Blastocladiella emersonii ATCC 22665]